MKRDKLVTPDEIVKQFHDGQTIMLGGFAFHGNPNRLIDLLLESGAKHLTTITMDGSIPGHDVARLIEAGRVDKMITSHVGRNPYAMQLFQEGKLEIEFTPLGTLIERVRCGGCGLGGVLVRTGLNTVVEEGKRIIENNGERFILADPLVADISLIKARQADPLGNLSYYGTTENSNPTMAMNPGLTIVEPMSIVEINEIGIDAIKTPGVFVDMILCE